MHEIPVSSCRTLCQNNRDMFSANRMADAILSNNDRDFFNEIKRVCGNVSCTPNAVDGVSCKVAIGELFARKFENVYNSVPIHTILMI